MGCFGKATCTVLMISAQTNQERIKCTKAKILLSNVYTVYVVEEIAALYIVVIDQKKVTLLLPTFCITASQWGEIISEGAFSFLCFTLLNFNTF